MRKSAAVFLFLAAGSAWATPPQPISNSVKYRDAGAKPATGRSGSAAIQVRALRGQTATDVELTTGQFEGTAAPLGKLDKVQVKWFAGNGDLLVTDNYRKELSGATARFTYGWPIRRQRVQVQANVSGIDPKRTDVVTVDGDVKLRPDLAVVSIAAPSQAYIGQIVAITAIVREANGDTGARANCVLKVDGVVADHADGIWVDAADAVTCEFRAVFPTLGRKQLTVALTDVNPGDYDNGNNSGSATLDIVPATTPVRYTMEAQDLTFVTTIGAREHLEFTSFNTVDKSYVWDYTGTSTDRGHVAVYRMQLAIDRAVELPVAVESTLEVDGRALLSGSLIVNDDNPRYIASGPGYWTKCNDVWDWSNRWSTICHYHSELDGVVRDMTTMTGGANGGTVTYASSGTTHWRYADGTTAVYTSNGGGSYIQGAPALPMPPSLGNNVAVRAAFIDPAGHRYEAGASVQLFPFAPTTDDAGERCAPFDYSSAGWGRHAGYNCNWPVTVTTGTAGSSSGEQ